MRGPGRAAVALAGLAVLAAGCLLGAPSPTPGVSPSAVASRLPVGSSAGTPAASVAASPAASTPAGGALVPGVYARVTVDGLRIRVAAKATATAVGALFFSDVVRIRTDAGVSGGFHWYEIETIQTVNDQQLTGFIAGAKGTETYLQALAGTPAPTPTRSATPSAAASPSASASG